MTSNFLIVFLLFRYYSKHSVQLMLRINYVKFLKCNDFGKDTKDSLVWGSLGRIIWLVNTTKMCNSSVQQRRPGCHILTTSNCIKSACYDDSQRLFSWYITLTQKTVTLTIPRGGIFFFVYCDLYCQLVPPTFKNNEIYCIQFWVIITSFGTDVQAPTSHWHLWKCL